MAQPTVKMYANIAPVNELSDAQAQWEPLDGKKIVWCGKDGTTTMADTAIPNKQRPTSDTDIVDEMWVGTTGSYKKINQYGATTGPLTPRGNVNVMLVTWNGPIATSPRITCYDATARTATRQILAGTADTTDTGGATSYIKARWSKAVNTSWCNAKTGSVAGWPAARIIDGSQNVVDSGNVLSQHLQGDSYYLENDLDTVGESDTAYGHSNGEHCFSNSTDTGKDYTYDLETRFSHSYNNTVLGTGRFTVFDILCWTGANLNPGTYNEKLSFRYTWT